MTWILAGVGFYAVTALFTLFLVKNAPLRDDIDD